MTTHPIDRARDTFEDYIEEGLGYEPSRHEARTVLDALAAAEKHVIRLEAQAAIRGRAIMIHQERAREAEARIQAVRDVCAQALAVKVAGSTETDAAMAAVASVVLRALDGDNGA